MVRFEFTMTDQDAENLLRILKDEQERCQAMAAHHQRLAQAEPEENNTATWYLGHAEYVEGLRQQILQGQIWAPL